MSQTLTETYPATVTATNDPEKRGRIRVACVGLMGDEETELPMWVEPALAWGWFVIPDVGEVVELEVVTGSSDDESFAQASIDGLDAKWKGDRYWGNSEGPAPRPVPEDFTANNYGKRRGFATPGGHVMLFDDTPGDERVSWTWKNKDAKFSSVSIDKDGSIVASDHSGNLLYMNAKKQEVALWDGLGNSYSSGPAGIKIVQKDSNLIELKPDGNAQILAQKGVVVNGANVHINASEINLGDGLAAALTEFAILGTTFINLFANHIHTATGATAPTTPPLIGDGGNPALWILALSTQVKMKPAGP